jgi:hypothetical protein
MARARRDIDTFTIPEGRRRRVYRPWRKLDTEAATVSTKKDGAIIVHRQPEVLGARSAIVSLCRECAEHLTMTV